MFPLSHLVFVPCRHHCYTSVCRNTQEGLTSTEKSQFLVCSSPRRALTVERSIAFHGLSLLEIYILFGSTGYFHIFHISLKDFLPLFKASSWKEEPLPLNLKKNPPFFSYYERSKALRSDRRKSKLRYLWDSTPCLFCSMMYSIWLRMTDALGSP